MAVVNSLNILVGLARFTDTINEAQTFVIVTRADQLAAKQVQAR